MNTTTTQSMRAALGYFILTEVWGRLITCGNAEALETVERLRRELLSECDNLSYLAMRAAFGWRSIDLTAWGEELDADLPEAIFANAAKSLFPYAGRNKPPSGITTIISLMTGDTLNIPAP